jgi:hypothetical protein
MKTKVHEAKLALCEVSGLLADLMSKLSGNEGAQWRDALKMFLRRQNPWTKKGRNLLESDYTVFLQRNISVSRRLAKSGLRSDMALQLHLAQLGNTKKASSHRILVQTASGLGAEGPTTLRDVLQLAAESGLRPVSAAVAAELAMNNPLYRQGCGSLYVVLPEPIGGQSPSHVLCLHRETGAALSGSKEPPELTLVPPHSDGLDAVVSFTLPLLLEFIDD